MYGSSKMTPLYPAPKKDAVDPVAEFLAKGGKIQSVQEGETAASSYTNHRMHEAENQTTVHNAYFR